MGKLMQNILAGGYVCQWSVVGSETLSATNVVVSQGEYSLMCRATLQGGQSRIWAVSPYSDLGEGETFPKGKVTFQVLSNGEREIVKVASVEAA